MLQKNFHFSIRGNLSRVPSYFFFQVYVMLYGWYCSVNLDVLNVVSISCFCLTWILKYHNWQFMDIHVLLFKKWSTLLTSAKLQCYWSRAGPFTMVQLTYPDIFVFKNKLVISLDHNCRSHWSGPLEKEIKWIQEYNHIVIFIFDNFSLKESLEDSMYDT